MQPREAADRPLRQGRRGRRRLGRGRVPVRLRRRPRRAPDPLRLRAVHPEVDRGEPVLRLGRRPPPPPPVARDRRLRDPREGPHPAPPRRPRGPARHLPRPEQPAGHRPPHLDRRHRGGAHAGAPVRARLPPRPGRPPQLLGLQLHRLPGAAQRVRGVRRAGPAGAGVQADGEVPAPGGHRGHPRRGLQPHRRGQRRWPDAVAQGRRQRRLLPAEPRRPPPLRRLHRHRQQHEHAPPARAAADHGLPAVLGHRDARRRLPLRPRRHPRPRAPRRRQAVGVLRPHPAGPGRQPGEAHRRAVGRRRGRLPGRELPGAVVGVERQVPRRDPRLLARGRAHRGRVRLPVHRLERPLPGQRPHARRRRSTSSPPTTASPSTTSSPTTASTTTPTARTTATAPTTTARGTAAPRARPTTSRSTPSAAASAGTCSPR